MLLFTRPLLIATLIFVSSGAPIAATTDIDAMFKSFKLKFEKSYASADEELARRGVFEANIAKINRLNDVERLAAYPPYGHLTPFMDLTSEEFRQKLGSTVPAHITPVANGPAPKKLSSKGRTSRRFHAEQMLQISTSDVDADNVTVFSYCPGLNCSPMQDQGVCGDCWAFAATEVLETVTALNGGGLTRLSPQELVDCYTTSSGEHTTCKTGGEIEFGWQYGEQNGIETIAQYPLTSTQSGQVGKCNGEQTSTGEVSSYSDAGMGDEQTMLNNLDNYGPIGVVVDASNWQFYDGGKTNGNPGCTPITNCGTTTDHAVEIVGTYNSTATYVDGWVIRNHWSTAWGCQLSGEGGYALLAMGNTCGIASYPVMVDVSTKVGKRNSTQPKVVAGVPK